MDPQNRILFFCELLACLTGLFYYNKVKNTYWKYFPFYLVFIVCSEITGTYLDFKYTNNIYYNINYFVYFGLPAEFVFLFMLFYSSAGTSKTRFLPLIFNFSYLIVWLIGILFLRSKSVYFDAISYTFGNLLLLILILRFFIQLVTSDDIVNFRQNMLFWVSFGLLLFYLGSFPYYCLINDHKIWITHRIIMDKYKIVVNGLNSLMYLMFTISFIWGKPNYQS